MVLQVPFEEFPAAVRRTLGEPPIYLCRSRSGCRMGAAENGIIVRAFASLSLPSAKHRLEQEGFRVFEGAWSPAGESTIESEPDFFVGAVAYQSADNKPGLWVDAFEVEPSHVDVVEAMYHDFVSTGELEGVTLDNFVRLIDPMVVVVTPAELASFLRRKSASLPLHSPSS